MRNRTQAFGLKDRWLGMAAALLALTLLASACSSSDSEATTTTATAPETTTTAGSTDTTTTVASTTTAAAPVVEACDSVQVTFIVSSRSIANQMVFSALEGGFLEDYGIDAEVVVADSSSPAMAALLSGDAQFMSGSRSEPVLASAAGQEVHYLLKHSSGFISQIAASNELIEAVGGDPASVPVEERLQALEGKTVALPSEGSVLTVVFNDAMESAGVSYAPTYIGNDAMFAALATGNVDAYFFPPPTPQQSTLQGDGGVFIEGSEFPLSGGPTMVQAPLMVTPDYLSENRDTVVCVTAAFLAAGEFHREDPEGAKALVQSRFDTLDPAVFELVWESVADTFTIPLDSPMSVEDIQFIIDNDLAANEAAQSLVASDLLVAQDVIDDARALVEQMG